MVTQSERFIPPTFESTMSQIKFVSRIRDTNQIHEFKMPVVLREPTGGTAVLIRELQNVTQKVRTCHGLASRLRLTQRVHPMTAPSLDFQQRGGSFG